MAFLGVMQLLDREIAFWEKFEAHPLIDERYAGLKKVLPSDHRLGHITDVPPDSHIAAALYYQSQYSLAPWLIVTNQDTQYVIVDLLNPTRAREFCLLHSLEPVASSVNGVILAKRQHEP